MIKTKPIQDPYKAKLTNGEGVAGTTCGGQLQHQAKSDAVTTGKEAAPKRENGTPGPGNTGMMER
jgi:hypothetical protein